MGLALRFTSAKELFSHALAITRARTDNWSHFLGAKKGEEPKPFPQKQSRLLLEYYIKSYDSFFKLCQISEFIAFSFRIFATGSHGIENPFVVV